MDLKQILEQYRNGERGLPTYNELAAIAGGDHDGHALINGGAYRAQAEARPVAEQWKTWVHEWMGEHDVILPTQAYTELLATHPEASAPGLSEGWKQAAEWLRDHYQDYSNVGSLVDAMRARASAATTCVACEGSPSAENNPCAVCGSAATVGESNTTDDDAFVWLETEISAVDCRYRGDPSYDHDAYWMRERVLKLVKEAKGIFGKAAQQQAQPECPRCGLTVSPESCDCAEARAVRTKQQAEPGADEWAEFETALKQYAEACHRSESCSAMDAARARVCAIFSRAAQSGQRAGAVNTRAAAMLRWVTHVLDDIIRTDSDYREGSRLNLGSERDRFKRALHKLHEAQALLAAAPTPAAQEGEQP